MKRFRCLPRLATCLLFWLTGVYMVPAAGQDEAAAVFEAHRDNVFQVRMLDRATGTKAGIGSGFLVSDEGHLVTNFHVVSQLIYKPDLYQVEYLHEDGQRGLLELRAIDVIHDLAILQAPQLQTDNYLRLHETEPRNGERLYAFGNPHDLGLTIVEGTYNGLLEKSLYDKIHFTASINPGMSGGPSVNRMGEVVGVNVSTAGNQLSFLVPSRYIKALLAAAANFDPAKTDFTAMATRQLLANQSDFVDKVLAESLSPTAISDYVVPGKFAPFLNCWGDTQQRDDTLYEWAYQACSTSDDLYLSENQTSGVISFSHELFTTKDLGPIRFFGFLQDRFQAHRSRLAGEEEMVTNFDCDTGFVEHNQVQSKVIFCLRAYKKFDGLYDAFLKSSILSRPDETLQSTLTLAGVSYENAVRLSKAFLETISWNR